jgi:hypothetical protein
MKSALLLLAGTVFVALLLGFLLGAGFISLHKLAHTDEVQNTGGMITLHAPFIYSFNSAGTLYESGSAYESSSAYWWLDSGGKLVIKDGVGETVAGDLPSSDRWAQLYAKSNPTDTDAGEHPQNLFRLVTKSEWTSATEQASFRIEKDNLSASTNRNASNGLLLMSRYGDAGQTLYYAGVRVDGTAVIKKKYKGTYYTMAQKQVFQGSYDPAKSPNLIPHGEWIALTSDTETAADGSVTVTLSMQLPGGAWTTLLSATDTGKNYGGTPPIASGNDGIRTDFMDVSFKDFRVTPR